MEVLGSSEASGVASTWVGEVGTCITLQGEQALHLLRQLGGMDPNLDFPSMNPSWILGGLAESCAPFFSRIVDLNPKFEFDAEPACKSASTITSSSGKTIAYKHSSSLVMITSSPCKETKARLSPALLSSAFNVGWIHSMAAPGDDCRFHAVLKTKFGLAMAGTSQMQ